MMFNNLELILDEVPILLVPQIEIRNGSKIWIAEGMSVKKTRKFKSDLTYTILNYNCDNLTECLLHETLHHYYPTSEETDIEIFTEMLWQKREYKKLFQNKIVEILGDYNL